MASSQTEIESQVIKLAKKSFKTFCGDISGMFGVDMECSPQAVGPETVKGLQTRFKDLVVVYSLKAEGALDGTLQLVFGQKGLFILAGIVAMHPEHMMLENIKFGSLEKAREISNILTEVGVALVGSWDRVFRKGLDDHGRFVQTNTFIGNPWDKSEEEIGLASDEELMFVPYEMTIAPYPAFKCGIIFPKAIFTGTESRTPKVSEGAEETEDTAAAEEAQPTAEKTIAADEAAAKQEPEAATEQEPEAAAGEEPEAAAEQEPEAAAEEEPEAATEQEPEAAAEQEPKAAAGEEPEAATEQEPEAAAEQEPEAAAGEEPEAAAGEEPEAAAEQEPEAAAGEEPEAAAEQEPEAAAEQEPEAAAGEEPEAATEQEPEAAADQKSSDTEEVTTATAETDESDESAMGGVSETIQKMAQSSAVLPGEPAPSVIAEKLAISSKDASSTVCAKDIMQRDVIWGNPDDSVQQALTKIQQHDAGYMMVGQGQVPEGVVSKSDLTGALSPYLRPTFAKWHRPLDDATLQIKIKWIMSKPTCTISPETSLTAIMENMYQVGRQCLPVVDEHGGVQGLVTVLDIFKVLLKHSYRR